MRIDDVCSIEEGHSPGASTYWVGSRTYLSRGQYDQLRPVIVLAKGSYVEYQGECGPAVQKSEVAPRRLVVATWRRGYDRVQNRWEPRVINGSAILLTNAEYQERVRLKMADQKRHALARKKVDARRKAVSAVVLKSLLPPPLAEKASITPYVSWENQAKGVDHYTVSIRLTPVQIRRLLSNRAHDALAELLTIKDPAC